jgi:hypothetical protein
VPAQVTDTPPAGFECSDGTVAASLAACLANMAQARLPPPPQIEGKPIGAVTGTAR